MLTGLGMLISFFTLSILDIAIAFETKLITYCINFCIIIFQLQLWDTAGQERFRKSMIPHYYRNVHAVVFVYDVTKISSFQNLTHWIGEFNQYQGCSTSLRIPRILVGNKCDCKNNVAVCTNMAQKFADIHDMPLFETSATDDSEADHVEAIFMTLAHKLKSDKPMMTPALPRNSSTVRIGTGSSYETKEDGWSCC